MYLRTTMDSSRLSVSYHSDTTWIQILALPCSESVTLDDLA